MQTQLPFFPDSTRLINSTLGIFQNDGFVYYLHNGNPVYCHSKDDLKSYRFISGNLVVNQLCTITELSECLGVNRKNIERYAKDFREKGAEHFFFRKETRGSCYKVTPGLLETIQVRLNDGISLYRIAQEEGISESAIRYHIKKGNLKKKIQ